MSDKHNGLAYAVEVDGDWYLPGTDEIPAKVAAQIGGHAWVNGKNPHGYKPAGSGKHSDSFGSSSDALAGDGPPPMAGAGSSTEAWVEYAKSLGIEVPAETKREDIVAALRDAGHPVDKTAD